MRRKLLSKDSKGNMSNKKNLHQPILKLFHPGTRQLHSFLQAPQVIFAFRHVLTLLLLAPAAKTCGREIQCKTHDSTKTNILCVKYLKNSYI